MDKKKVLDLVAIADECRVSGDLASNLVIDYIDGLENHHSASELVCIYNHFFSRQQKSGCFGLFSKMC